MSATGSINAPNSEVKLNLLAIYPSKKSVRLETTNIPVANPLECVRKDKMNTGIAASRNKESILGTLRRRVLFSVPAVVAVIAGEDDMGLLLRPLVAARGCLLMISTWLALTLFLPLAMTERVTGEWASGLMSEQCT